MNRIISLLLIVVALASSSVQGFAPSSLSGVSGGELFVACMVAGRALPTAVPKEGRFTHKRAELRYANKLTIIARDLPNCRIQFRRLSTTQVGPTTGRSFEQPHSHPNGQPGQVRRLLPRRLRC